MTLTPDFEAPINLDECASFLSKSKSTIYQYVSANSIPYHKKGKSLYFFKSELTKWIKDSKA